MFLQQSDEQQMLRDAAQRLFGEHSTSARIRASGAQGFDRALWDVLLQAGMLSLRISESEGGASLLHAITLAEEAGRALASVPLIEAVVVHRLLSLIGDEGTVLRADIESGKTIVTFALHDVALQPSQLVPGGAVADLIVSIEGGAVTIRSGFGGSGFGGSGFANGPQSCHGHVPAAWLDLAHSSQIVRIEADDASRQFLAMVEEWKLLCAALVTAAALRSLELAAEYSRDRIAFGKPIGSFQGVAHPLADSRTDLEGARLLVWRAIAGIARDEVDAAALVSMAYWWAATAARTATLRALHVFGGYGVTIEHDAPLYFGRVNGWSLVMGDPDLELDRAAFRLWEGETAALPEAGEIGIDFSFGEEAERMAAQARTFCMRHDTEELRHYMRESGDHNDPELYRELAAAGLLYPDFPKEYGGQGLGALIAAAVRTVFNEYFWQRPAPRVTSYIAHMLNDFGSEEVKREVLPRLLPGNVHCSLGFTEPSVGSDVFSGKTTAERQGDDWLINGQKSFTTNAHFAEYCLVFARTGSGKYGATLFLVPLTMPGCATFPIWTVGNEMTNSLFLTDVVVPDRYRIGDVDGGVKTLATALKLEHIDNDLYVMTIGYLLRNALAWARAGTPGTRPIDNARIRFALAETAVRLRITDALVRYAVWASAADVLPKYLGPMSNLFGGDSWLACSERLFQLAAPHSLIEAHDPVGNIEWMSRRALPATIYGGTSEIHRSIIAESALGMPRSRA